MSAPDKWLFRDSYINERRRANDDTYQSYFAQHHIYPPLKNKVFIWDSPRPDTEYGRKDLDHIQESFFFGSFKPLATIAWMPHLPDEINSRPEKDHIQESFFFESFKSIKTVAWMPVQMEMVKVKRHGEYQSFFMNIKTIPTSKTVWQNVNETDNSWVKIKETL